MIDKVLNRVKPGGYFAGGFFGDNHDWYDENYKRLTFLVPHNVYGLMDSNDFTVCQLTDSKTYGAKSVNRGTVNIHHEIWVIARKNETFS